MTPVTSAPEGLLLRLAAPLQSYGERSHFNERDTAPFPTRSAVIGLLASALHRRRDHPIDDLAELSVTVRVDRPGVVLRDLHTVGGGLPAKDTVTTAQGKKRQASKATLLTHRHYLADAAFTLAVTGGPQHAELLAHTAHALTAPGWPPFLGRRSCPPEGPLLLGTSPQALRHLMHLPLAAPPPRAGADRGVDFLSDRPLTHLTPDPNNQSEEEQEHAISEVNDQPITFHPRHRAYRARPQYRRTLHLPAAQHTGYGLAHLKTLATYMNDHLNQPEGSDR